MFATAFLDLPPLDRAAGTVRLPGSKSISNRVLLLAALSGGTTRLHELLDSDDTRVMLDALRALGCGVRHSGTTVEISGLGGQAPASHARLFLGNAGTAMRPQGIAAFRPAISFADRIFCVNSVTTNPGDTALTSTLYGASSTAAARVNPRMPDLLAE